MTEDEASLLDYERIIKLAQKYAVHRSNGEPLKFIHWIQHLFGWNTGTCYSWWDGDTLMMGFRCDGCESITGVHEVAERKLP